MLEVDMKTTIKTLYQKGYNKNADRADARH